MQSPIRKDATNYKMHHQLLYHQRQKILQFKLQCFAISQNFYCIPIPRNVFKLFRHSFVNLMSPHFTYIKMKRKQIKELLQLLHIQASTLKSVFNWKSWELYFPLILYSGPSRVLQSPQFSSKQVLMRRKCHNCHHSNSNQKCSGFERWVSEWTKCKYVRHRVLYRAMHSTNLFHITTV